jgi:SAM-dependent methyltransferase
MLTNNGVQITKGTIHDITEKFSLIMLHHSFEHVEDQLPTLQKIKSLLLSGGVCLIRIPVKNEAWNLYKEDWFQIDAPRHFYLHTERSFGILAEQAGLEIYKTVYDSNEFQFIASELYQQDVPLIKQGELHGEIPQIKWEECRAKAKEFNNSGKGDQAAFFLRAKK